MQPERLDIFLGQESLESALKLTGFDADHYRQQCGLDLPQTELFADFICRGRYTGLTARPFSPVQAHRICEAAGLPLPEDGQDFGDTLTAFFAAHSGARRQLPPAQEQVAQAREGDLWRLLLPQVASAGDTAALPLQDKMLHLGEAAGDRLEQAVARFLDTGPEQFLGTDMALLLHQAALELTRPLTAEYFLLCHHFGTAWSYPTPLRCHYNTHPYSLVTDTDDCTSYRDATLVGGLPLVIAADHRTWGWRDGHAWLDKSPYCLGVGAGYASLLLRKASQARLDVPCVPLWHAPQQASAGVPAECYGGLLSLAADDRVPVIHRQAAPALRQLVGHLSPKAPVEAGNWDRLECAEVIIPQAHHLSSRIPQIGERLAARLLEGATGASSAEILQDSIDAATLFFRVSQKEAQTLTVPAFNRAIEAITDIAHPAQNPPGTSQGDRPLVVILATRLFNIGGHSRIIEDVRQALDTEADFRIVLTDIVGNHEETTRPWLSAPATPVTRLLGDSAHEKLLHGLNYLASLPVDVLFDASHPFDSVALGLLRHCQARRKIHLLHADHSFALRPAAGDCALLSVTPAGRKIADALASRDGAPWFDLPMTCDDPWQEGKPTPRPRPTGLLTATSGHFVKFEDHDGLSYADLLNTRFRARGGNHVHIGPLPPARKKELLASLEDPAWVARFHHIDRVPSLSKALAELGPDLYLNSFPVAGIKAGIEAMAAGCAICHRQTGAIIDGAEVFHDGALAWRDMKEFETLLAAVDHDSLSRQKSMARRHYEDHHSPAAFGASLRHLFFDRV